MNKDLTVGKPSSVLAKFCLPLFGSIIFQQLYNIADSWVAGKFINQNALASVGNSYEITLIFIAFAFGCNIACSVIVSRFFGGKDYGKMKTAVYTSMVVSGAVCAVLMLVGLLFCTDLLNLIKTPPEILADSVLYLDIYIWGLPFVFFYNIATGIFSALGDSKTPFIFLAISSLFNIGMDILFVTKFGMGVEGVAIATLICQSISCILALFTVFMRLKKFNTGKVKLFSLELVGRFAEIAVPSTLQQCFISVGNVIIQGIINGFGPEIIAGYSASVKLNNLVITSFTTLANGISNYASQNLGAGKPERIKSGFFAGLKLVFAISLPLTLLYFFFCEPLMYLFLDSPTENALNSGIAFLKILSPFYLVISAKLVADGMLRGANKMNQFMIATFTDLLIRVVLAFILSSTALGYLGIWCAWPVGWTLTTAMSLLFFFEYNAKSLSGKSKT